MSVCHEPVVAGAGGEVKRVKGDEREPEEEVSTRRRCRLPELSFSRRERPLRLPCDRPVPELAPDRGPCGECTPSRDSSSVSSVTRLSSRADCTEGDGAGRGGRHAPAPDALPPVRAPDVGASDALL